MFAIWNKLLMDIEPAEISKAIEVFKYIDNEDIAYCFNETLVRYGLQWDSLFNEYYIKRNDEFQDELWIKQLLEITTQQIRDYIGYMENMDYKEIQYIFNDLLNVLGITQDVKFRDFFIDFMNIYNSSEEVRDKYKELARVDDNAYE